MRIIGKYNKYYNGWATNKVGIIYKKAIIPLSAYRNWDGRYEPDYSVRDKISDIEKVFNFLDCGITPDINTIDDICKKAKNDLQTKKVEFKYFYCTFYKKGTTHIEFKEMDLLKRFNIFAGRKVNGLPPSYGKKKYSDMTQRERQIIDSFEGKKEYNKVFNNREMFIIETEKVLMLT